MNIHDSICFIEIANKWNANISKGCKVEHFSGTTENDLVSLNIHYNCNSSSLIEAKELEEDYCKCKPMVVGKNCNECRQGTWNLTQENPMGCQSKHS